MELELLVSILDFLLFKNQKFSILVLLLGGYMDFTWLLSGPQGISSAQKVGNPPFAKRKKENSIPARLRAGLGWLP